MGGRYGCAERHVTHVEVPHTVKNRDLAGAGACRDLPDDLFDNHIGVGVCLVVDGGDRPRVVVIAYLAAEADDGARGIVVDLGDQLRHVDGFVADARPHHSRVRAVVGAAVLDRPSGGLMVVHHGRLGGGHRDVQCFFAAHLFHNVCEERADGGDDVAHPARRTGRVDNKRIAAVNCGDAGEPARERGRGNGGVVPHEGLDAGEPPRQKWFGAFGGEVARGDPGSAGGHDHVGSAANRLRNRVLHGLNAIGNECRPGDGPELSEQVGR